MTSDMPSGDGERGYHAVAWLAFSQPIKGHLSDQSATFVILSQKKPLGKALNFAILLFFSRGL
jgi:putative heme iron utilization protein